MRKIIALLLGSGLAVAIASPAAASASRGSHPTWPALCVAAPGGLCAQAGRRYVVAEPFGPSFKQADVWVNSSETCGPGLHPVVLIAPYWCPFTARALDTQFSGEAWSLVSVGMAGDCAGVGTAGRVKLDLCWKSGTFMVQVPVTGGFELVSILASDRARHAMYLTAGAKGAPLTWRPTATAASLWTFRSS